MKVEITIDVDDLELAVKFYCEVIGLKLIERGKTWARTELDDQTFWICEFEAGKKGGIARDFQRHWTPVHLDFIVKNLDSALARALDTGGRLDRAVRRDDPEPLGICDVANLSDPAGNGVDLIQRR